MVFQRSNATLNINGATRGPPPPPPPPPPLPKGFSPVLGDAKPENLKNKSRISNKNIYIYIIITIIIIIIANTNTNSKKQY